VLQPAPHAGWKPAVQGAGSATRNFKKIVNLKAVMDELDPSIHADGVCNRFGWWATRIVTAGIKKPH
jgi:hypothetical protein